MSVSISTNYSDPVQGIIEEDALKGSDWCIGGLKAGLLTLSAYSFGVNFFRETPGESDFDQIRHHIANGSALTGQIGSFMEWLQNCGLIQIATQTASWIFSAATAIYLIKYVSEFIDIHFEFEEIAHLRERIEPYRLPNMEEGWSEERFEQRIHRESAFREVSNYLALGVNLCFTCWVVASLITLIAGAVFSPFVGTAFMVGGLICFTVQSFMMLSPLFERLTGDKDALTFTQNISYNLIKRDVDLVKV